MKKIKDPIYGYINIDNEIVNKVIDTDGFQRLRNIIQTSYSPLYASAVHNRFVHSLGVYHLGILASNALFTSIEEIDCLPKEHIEKYVQVFLYACLLHDFGHAPFSHTGEEFYLDKNSSRGILHDKLTELVNDEELSNEIITKNYAAAPHEIMSAILSLQKFPELFSDDKQRSFFARCICGYLYTNIDTMNSFLNCLIALLNSSFIDVDKLDYLIRDAYITGFDTISIDYKRLLDSIRIVNKEGLCELVYLKSAISVIENVVLAHDAERKWIQNHPVVQYDSYLLKHAIEKINDKYKVFNFDALTTTGVNVCDDFKVSLLCDGDVLFLMKNIEEDSLIQEYFSRQRRRHPLWKSESEYKAFFNPVFADNTFKKIEDEFEDLVKYLNYSSNSSEINSKSLSILEKDIEDNESLIEIDPKNKGKYEKQLSSKRKHRDIIKVFEEYANEQNIDFDFVILRANQFNSGFLKIGFENIKIAFNNLGKPVSFKDITNSLSAKKSEREKFFYLFYRRSDECHDMDIKSLVIKLGKVILESAYE